MKVAWGFVMYGVNVLKWGCRSLLCLKISIFYDIYSQQNSNFTYKQDCMNVVFFLWMKCFSLLATWFVKTSHNLHETLKKKENHNILSSVIYNCISCKCRTYSLHKKIGDFLVLRSLLLTERNVQCSVKKGLSWEYFFLFGLF